VEVRIGEQPEHVPLWKPMDVVLGRSRGGAVVSLSPSRGRPEAAMKRRNPNRMGNLREKLRVGAKR
jgi:hypothetical protein